MPRHLAKHYKKGTYKRKDIYSYKFANAADDFAKVLKSARVSIRTLAFMDHVANTTKDFTQRFLKIFKMLVL